MPIGINVKVDGEDRVLRRIDKISKLPSNLQPIYKEWAGLLRREWNDNFSNQGAYGGNWSPLKYKKPKKYEGNPIGVNSGEMKAAVTGGAGAVTDISNTKMEIGVDMLKAVIFHRGKYNQESRKIITLNNTTKNRLMQTLRLWINREMNR
jgi:phage gpG-like protein